MKKLRKLMTEPELSGPQRQRLSELSDGVLKALKQEHVARIKGELGRLTEAIREREHADWKFRYALRMRGFVVGDVVRIVMPGSYLNKKARILDMEPQRLRVQVDGQSVLPFPHEVEMVVAYEGGVSDQQGQ